MVSPLSLAKIRIAFMLDSLPWLGPHPHRAVALEQFDAVVAFLVGIDKIRQVQILVEIHEVLFARMGENRIAMAGGLSHRRRERGHLASAVAGVVRCPKPGQLSRLPAARLDRKPRERARRQRPPSGHDQGTSCSSASSYAIAPPLGWVSAALGIQPTDAIRPSQAISVPRWASIVPSAASGATTAPRRPFCWRLGTAA